jgi:hypothetical protein
MKVEMGENTYAEAASFKALRRPQDDVRLPVSLLRTTGR